MMNAPRCSACDRFAIVEIEDNVLLCRRCEVILRKQFPNVARRLSDLSPATATAASGSASSAVAELIAKPVSSASTASPKTTQPEAAETTSASESIAAFPEIPDFLRRAVA